MTGTWSAASAFLSKDSKSSPIRAVSPIWISPSMPESASLRALESDLTKARELEKAEVILAYREGLGVLRRMQSDD